MNQLPNNTNQQFPDAFKKREEDFLKARRLAAEVKPDGNTPDAPIVGLALSGGGIRSATFSLGLLQALAKLNILPRIDYLSTVSGGGYIGSFLGALFARKELPTVDGQPVTPLNDAQDNASRPGVRHAEVRNLLTKADSAPLHWLRENGRYLTPNGGGDTIMAMGIALRNWMSVLSVMAIMTLTVFLFSTFIELSLITLSPKLMAWWKSGLFFGEWLWWSPWWILPIAIVSLCLIPIGWAYWLPPAQAKWRWLPPFTVFVLFVGAAYISSHWFLNLLAHAFPNNIPVTILQKIPLHELLSATPTWAVWLAIYTSVITFLTLVIGFIIWYKANNLPLYKLIWNLVSWDMSNRHANTYRKIVSSAIAFLIPVIAALAAFALIDSLGRTIYTICIAQQSNGLILWLSGMSGAILAIFTVMQKFMAVIMPAAQERRSLPVGIIAGLLAIIVMASSFTVLNALSHAIGWSFQQPAWTSDAAFIPHESATRSVIAVDSRVVVAEPSPSTTLAATAMGEPCPLAAAVGLAICVFLTVSTAYILSFVNHSSLAIVYAARLTRSYLGASNPKRQNAQNRITDVVQGDDLPLYPYSDESIITDHYAPHAHGGPIHLINVTINETLDGKSGIQNMDRKGVGMAVGPAGVSVGVRHHAQWPENARIHDGTLPLTRIERPGYHVFPPGLRSCEATSIGRLISISGAAFSTGIGSRTSFGLSLLCGFFNVRTGYWWRSGKSPKEQSWSIQLLLWEWMARFPGTAWNHWYLSDGGHFENLACYEMIRRRLPFIICLDNGEDPEVLFEDLGGLVRKARLDFDTKITFLTTTELIASLDEDQRKLIGTLDQMRPTKNEDGSIKPPTACATLARIHYTDEITGTLLYIKPTMLGGEPEDVRYYQRSNPTFPHQATGDQFFDEAQWESYRQLGEHLGTRLFSTKSDQWHPAQMVALSPSNKSNLSPSATSPKTN